MKHNFTLKNNSSLVAALSENVGGVSLPALKALIKSGEVRLNGAKQTKDCEVKIGDSLSVFIPAKYQNERQPRIVFSDENIAIVDKPPLFDVENNLLLWVRKIFPKAEAAHRLDRNTSGLVVFSLNPAAQESLLAAFKSREIEKLYLARVAGDFRQFGLYTAYLKKDAGKAEVKISPSPLVGFKKIITEFLPFDRAVLSAFDKNKQDTMPANSKTSPNITVFESDNLRRIVLEGECTTSISKHDFTDNSAGGEDKTTLLRVRLVTGRTHQIRAHLAFLGHKVLGDGRYGRREILDKDTTVSIVDNAVKEQNNAGIKSVVKAKEDGRNRIADTKEELATNKNVWKGYSLCAQQITFVKLTSPLNYLNGKTFLLKD